MDDEPDIVVMIARFARPQGFDVITRAGGHGLIKELPALKPHVVLLDRNMPGVTGLEILRAIRDADPTCQVILMTGDATVDSAVEAVKLGALDYLSKPLDFERLGELLRTIRLNLERRQRLLTAESELASSLKFHGMVGRSPVMHALFDLIRRLAPHARTALVVGETGTGKELVARALHALGPRRHRKFIALNCSAVVETLFESELFGHTRGAFTGAVEAKAGVFELADGGTLFLDEVGELPLAVQAKLLRVFENGEFQRVGAAQSQRVDIHVIAATNRRLIDEVAAGRFRQDLYYRLNVVEIALAPLRERRLDIAYLTAVFINEFAERFRKPLIGVTPGAERLLHDAPWPGNIRELRNVLERACILSDDRLLSEREVAVALGGSHRAESSPTAGDVSSIAEQARERDAAPELDRHTIEHALHDVHGNLTAAAKKLGTSRRTLYRRLDALGLRESDG